MREYEVTQACYVPVGPGFRYKVPGQRVRLSAEDAAELGKQVVAVPDRVRKLNTLAPAAAGEGVQKLNTPKESKKAKADPPPETAEEVVDVSEPGAADERAAAQDRE